VAWKAKQFQPGRIHYFQGVSHPAPSRLPACVQTLNLFLIALCAGLGQVEVTAKQAMRCAQVL
jgi:hypothetical protein